MKIPAWNFGLEFWPEISAQNFRAEILAWFSHAKIPGRNSGPEPEILAWPEISARRWIDPKTCSN